MFVANFKDGFSFENNARNGGQVTKEISQCTELQAASFLTRLLKKSRNIIEFLLGKVSIEYDNVTSFTLVYAVSRHFL